MGGAKMEFITLYIRGDILTVYTCIVATLLYVDGTDHECDFQFAEDGRQVGMKGCMKLDLLHATTSQATVLQYYGLIQNN